MTTQRVKGWVADTDVPGIFISDNGGPPVEPRARLEGTGLDVWEVINTCRGADWDTGVVAQVWPHLSREIIEAAFLYYARHTDEIDALIAENDSYGPQENKPAYRNVDPQSLIGTR